MAKSLSYLDWVEDLLPKGFVRKAMFGGFGYYLQDKMILVMFEDEHTRSYKNKQANFAIWNGCMFPVEKSHHKEVLQKFKFLINHPVLPKWLYLPVESENFEENVNLIMTEIRRRNVLFGVVPKPKHGKTVSVLKANQKQKNEIISRTEKIDLRQPRMFSDEPVEKTLNSAVIISDLKNLGPSSEKAFKKAGIKDAKHFIKLGWKRTLEKLVKSNPNNAHSVFTYALIGALKNKEFHQISEADKIEAQQFTKAMRNKYKKKAKKIPNQKRKNQQKKT
jgi:hypothetical protein